MMWFLTCVAALIGGYFIYGAFVEKIFGINENRQTPAHTKTDGVDTFQCQPSVFTLFSF